MSINIKRSFRLFCMTLCIACSSTDDKTEQLKNYLNQHDIELKDYKSIFIVTEEGCPKCAKSYANYLGNSLFKDSVLYIITAQGNTVDISSFTALENSIFDMEKKVLQLGLTEVSAAIFLDEGRIDTTIEIKPVKLKATLNFLTENRSEN